MHGGDDGLAAVLDAVLTVGMYMLLFRAGRYFYERFLSGYATDPSQHGAATSRLFAVTFAASFALYLLLLSEIVGFLHASSRKLIWQINLNVLLVLLILMQPSAFWFTMLANYRLTKWRAALATLLAQLLLLYMLYKIGDPFFVDPHARTLSALQALLQFFTYEHVLSRVLIIGTTLLATISGFAAVNIPFDHISFFLRRVSAAQVEAMELRLSDAVQRVYRMKLADQKLNTGNGVSPSAVSNDEAHPAFSAEVLGSANLSVRDRGHTALAENAEHVPVPDPLFERQSSARTMTRSFSVKPSREELEFAVDEVNHLFENYNEALELWSRHLRSRSFSGRLLAAFGWVMLVACIVRVGGAIANVFVEFHRRNGNLTDNLSQGLHTASRVVGLEINAIVLAQYASFIFTFFLIVVNVRGALTRVLRLFLFVSLSNSSLAYPSAIMLSELIGLYAISSIVLIRNVLPRGYRLVIADALGDVKFSFFKRWFDSIFIVSAGAGTLMLALQHVRSYRRVEKSTRHLILGSGFRHIS
ncbi:Golgi pH regulator [Porphyridium purpureum]|uniref:Golgi pH regulator n=1 Tax=Porphyridium purpureum TaxID=35688 RepID=A0A5J4YLI6_PORPP|nr:Golgi pH regulator [Porphyridium purpureum]|eukprot:POR4282..scf244_11